MTGQSGNRGFTLVEVLVAITIFALVVSTLYTSFNLVISQVDPMKKGLDNYTMARSAMDRIKKDLLSICITHKNRYTRPDPGETDDPDPFRLVSNTESFFGSEFSYIRFASFAHLALDRDRKSRIGILSYYVTSLEDGTVVLKRADTGVAFYTEDQETRSEDDPVLCENIRAFDIKFVDQEGKLYKEWHSDTSSFEFSTPSAVKIKLEVGSEQRSDVFATTIVLPTYRGKIES